MSQIDEVFRELRGAGRCALVPFVTAGDPSLQTTHRLLLEFARRGCACIELGIPYSDPIADGPVIQASYTRALEKGLHVRDILAAVRDWTMASQGPAAPKLPPLIAMVSYSIVFRHGPAAYVRAAREAGFAGAIVPDLPVPEAEELAALARAQDLSLIQLITPTTPWDRAERIVACASGFVYYVSVTGTTGERDRLPPQLSERLRRLRDLTELPICVGFGISRPQQVWQLRGLADGVIVGSAVMRRITETIAAPEDQLAEHVGEFVGSLADALHSG